MNIPEEIKLLPDGIHILWNDGVWCSYEYRTVRFQCGCAHCVNEMTGVRVISLSEINSDIQAIDYMYIGKYAVHFLWTDLHTTGIYPFETLRKLCETQNE